ncbi:demethylrebeccamycin-D-glucose O-methyltransferase [Streptomyces acidiscabies]|nr:demethylrebeccamycin-D-glucose O-methyltransferase [Streptomyces acidiscabies]GAV37960.1 demethylrebeccamycin-D-glucose O-methyltransferase [Streptomyces acidiscabies]
MTLSDVTKNATPKKPPTVNRTVAPQPRRVGDYYDHKVFDLMTQLGDGNLHYGYWHDDSDRATFDEAMVQMTDEMIRRLDPAPGDRVLDVGCGNGTPALQLARARDVHVVGISVSARQVERGNRRAQEAGLADRVRFEQINAMDLPFEDGSFDRAWALESMLHMPDKRQVLAEMCRVVRPGARIPIADMVYLGPEAGRGPSVTVSDTHIYASLTDIEDYPDVIRAAGLSVLELTDITHETARTNDGYLDWIRAHRDEYVDIIGVEGYELIVHNQQALGRMPELGYIFATAQRPGP